MLPEAIIGWKLDKGENVDVYASGDVCKRCNRLIHACFCVQTKHPQPYNHED